jgi:hypothetical protein
LLAAISIVPWRLVAQERSAADPARPTAAAQDPRQPTAPVSPAQAAGQAAPGSAGGQVASENGTKEQMAQEKLIVGTWRGKATTGETSELVLRSDGTYQKFDSTVQEVPGHVRGQQPMEAGYVRELGRWKLADDTLLLTPKAQGGVDVFEKLLTAGATGGPAPPEPVAGHFKIVRLDDALLRLQPLRPDVLFLAAPPDARYVPTDQAIFYHRVDPKDAPTDFDPKLPAQLRQVAALAGLAPKDASKIAPWFPEKDSQSDKPLHWELVERLAKAREGKIDFAELFGLDANEAKAYVELWKLAHSYNGAWSLADDGQLSRHELSAITKIKAFSTDYQNLVESFGYAIQGMLYKAALKQPGGASFLQETNAAKAANLGATDEFEAGTKLKLFLDELNSYLEFSVIGSPPPVAGANPAAAGMGARDHDMIPAFAAPPGAPGGRGDHE